MPPNTQDLVRELARKGESFSATVVRLVRLGARQDERNVSPDYFGSGEGPGDLGINNEKYLGSQAMGAGRGSRGDR